MGKSFDRCERKEDGLFEPEGLYLGDIAWVKSGKQIHFCQPVLLIQ
jgi:hypothetical protein